MKRVITGAFTILFVIAFFGCSPEPTYYGKHVYRYRDVYGDWWYSGGGPAPKASDFADIDCEDGNAGCQALYDAWGGAGSVTVMRSNIDTLYRYYFRNDMSTLYQRHNLHSMFPRVDIEKPGALDSLITGKYLVHVCKEDSSILIYEPSFGGRFSTIVYAFERNDYHPKF